MDAYSAFIASKRLRAMRYGFEPTIMNPKLKDWQARIVDWAVRRGRAAIFADTGLGKTLMQLSWSENIVANHGPVLLLCPLGVRHQTVDEAYKFGVSVEVKVVESTADLCSGVNVTNYDKLHLFDPTYFAGIVLDESSILKSMTGKIRGKLTESFGSTQFKLCCTATPSPNDNMELGNHAEFLSVMASSDMLNRFFYHDSGETSKWVIRPHGSKAFWDWVASWAVCIGMPSDIGGSDKGYILPGLKVYRHFVESENLEAPTGMLFNTLGVSATTIHEEKRMTCESRVAKAAEIANGFDEPCVVWCDTNQESSMLAEMVHGAQELTGSDSTATKEQLLDYFVTGRLQKLITKPKICGMGLNWQHCSKMIFAGLTYSFEQYYQAVRRVYRFGQLSEVDIHIVLAETDSAINAAIARKESDFATMRAGMADAMRTSTWQEFGLDSLKKEYVPQKAVDLPDWIPA